MHVNPKIMRDLPRFTQEWLNAPLCVSRGLQMTATSVFSGRLNIESLRDEFGRTERAEMEAIAAEAKIDADAKRASRSRGTILETVEDIAVIQVYGALTRTWGIGPYSGATGYDGILMQLEDAIRNPDINGIWMDFDSGGGTINGLFDLADMIHAMRSRSGEFNDKPIWGMAADYAFSAAYLLLSSCDKCFVPPTGGVGSAGTITMHVSYRRANEDEGIDVNVLRYPELKAKATEFEDLDDETRDHIMGQLVDITGMMHDRIARNMSISKSRVAQTKGLDYMGRHAKAIGFVTDCLPEAVVWEDFKRIVARRRKR